MPDGKHQIYTFEGTNGISAQLWAWESWDPATNSSSLSIEMLFSQKYYNAVYYLQGSISVDGKEIISFNSATPTHNVYTQQTGEWYGISAYPGYKNQPFYATVPHNTDGSKTVNISCAISGYAGSNNWYISTSQSMELTKIPRTSTLTAPDGVMGETVNLSIAKAAPSLRHTITYTCGDASGTIASNDDRTVIPFAIPIGLAAQNTRGKTATITYTIITYTGSTELGRSSVSATLTIPSSLRPRVSAGWAGVTYNNAGTKASNIAAFVQGYSKAEVTFNGSLVDVSGSYGATIDHYSIVHGATEYRYSPYRTGVLNASGNQTVTCYVYDSRGYFESVNLGFFVNPYAIPTLSGIEVFRCDGNGLPNASGTYLSVKGIAAASAVSGLNSVTLTAKYKQTEGGYTSPITLQNGVVTILGGGLISAASSYIVMLAATDTLGNEATVTVQISTDSVAFNIRDRGNGAAFGKYAEHDKMLDIPGDWVFAKNGKNLEQIIAEQVLAESVIAGIQSRILNAAYPVGAIYISTSATSPQTIFGGTWERILDRFLLAAGNSYGAGSTGGEAAHTLSVAEMPSHNHGFNLEGGNLDKSTGYVAGASGSTGGSGWAVTSYNGSTQAHNNMPPYLAVYIWKRTA